ncbi:heat-inducible transcription repressor HrcA [Caminicella sporogenes DSM 14501]|uniref:Heat-inducible transcription repressor HrcA n=1 Tax=Caminicella sporogenes DSM 14501 TaxID=1121266 RepID=A0A1M6MCQ7_9FIRM|nr:heat-inducible transcriptional repressor HrcA [Caminicella sporogenes]SHJ81221.1 heat-inducible transcription repressor HrcA [Caminicella sporogenes DSM 14501]
MESGNMTLVDRKLKILQAIIDDFITTAQPVGSRTIAKKYNLGISSATIRNEMSDLEELGYLVQPHTSAGRIPSDLGYRLYVDVLMKHYELAAKQKLIIKQLLLDEINKIEDLVQQASKVLSHITNLTSLSLSPQFRKSKLKNIKLVKVDSDKVLLILVSNTGIVKNVLLRIKEASQDVLDRISNLLQHQLKGFSIDELSDDVILNLKNEIVEYGNTIESLVLTLKNTLKEIDDREIYLDGLAHIFNLPEYTDINKAKQFISTIEKKDLLYEALKDNYEEDITIKIGRENNLEEIKDCSLITATYKLNGKVIGKIGVIGPTRMNYARIIPVMEYITKILTDILNKNY